MSEPWRKAFNAWWQLASKRSTVPSAEEFRAGWHARDEEVKQLRAIAERGATNLDLAAETFLAHPELDRDVFLGTLRRQAQRIRNALAANVPVSEMWKEGKS